MNCSGNFCQARKRTKKNCGSEPGAMGRPVDLLVVPDGSLPVSNDLQDAAYRIPCLPSAKR